MQHYEKAVSPDELFAPGREKGAFIRLNALNSAAEAFLIRFADAARKNGALIEGKLPNPSEEQIEVYNRTVGTAFRVEAEFVESSLALWMPSLGDAPRARLSASLYDALRELAAQGKTEGILKNAFIKFFCWLRWHFENAAMNAGELPKVLYQGSVSVYELRFLSALCASGCDIALVQTEKDDAYRRLDPQDSLSQPIELPDGRPFPEGFSVSKLSPARPAKAPQLRLDRIVPTEPPKPEAPKLHIQLGTYASRQQNQPETKPAAHSDGYEIVPNRWSRDRALDRVAMPSAARGGENHEIRTTFAQLFGVEDRAAYPTELLALRGRVEQSGRRLLVLEEALQIPTTDEIAKIRRSAYATANAVIDGLSDNLRSGVSLALEPLAVRAFKQVMTEESERPGMNVSRLAGQGVYLLCWFRRFYDALFSGWKPKEIACLIRLGGIPDAREALFLRMIARLPADVLVLIPNLDEGSLLEDSLLQTERFPETLRMDRFPDANAATRVTTSAAHAESEINSLNADCGIYRSRQFEVARTLELNTTYEEIALYWENDLKYRQGFATVNGTVMMPVLFAQVSGIQGKRVKAYWRQIKRLMNAPDTYTVLGFPNIVQPAEASRAVPFYKNGQIDRDRLITSPLYPFARLRDTMQTHILDMLQQLIDSERIRGTHRSGMEYNIIATVMSIHTDLLRMIQQFDFTGRNPKILCVHSGEGMASREDAIMLAFLHLIGFDIVCFVPTGYSCFSQWYTDNPVQEHLIGDFVYDLPLPDFTQIPTWTIFGR